MQVGLRSGLDVGKRGTAVQKQGQACALSEVGRGGSSANETLGVGEKVSREGRAIVWQWPRHETAPRATGRLVVRDDALTIGRSPNSATLQLFVKRTT
jgi:hypothetical protein